MRLLITSSEIEKEFKRLMVEYSEYYWATAWAGADFEYFKMLMKYKGKIRKVIVGTSFDHTHPKFIETFIKDKHVKFSKQSNEIFHPKIYLFQNNKDEWEVLIGSMNFTSAGFYDNVEALILISNKDKSDLLYKDTLDLINKSWEKAIYFTKEKLQKYTLAYKNQQKRSGEYVKNKPGKPVNRTEIMNLSWEDFIKKIGEGDKQSKEGRIKLLKMARGFFLKHKHFNKMDTDERKAIAGTKKELNGIFCWWFGHMPNSIFKRKIKENNLNISRALDQIPLEGVVPAKQNYLDFIEFFTKAFQKEKRKGKVTAFRLLAMKRPDVFICLDSANEKKLKRDFGIKGEITFERYWDDIIERIFDSEWYNTPAPKDKEELEIWKGRSAFLDVIFYDG